VIFAFSVSSRLIFSNPGQQVWVNNFLTDKLNAGSLAINFTEKRRHFDTGNFVNFF